MSAASNQTISAVQFKLQQLERKLEEYTGYWKKHSKAAQDSLATMYRYQAAIKEVQDDLDYLQKKGKT